MPYAYLLRIHTHIQTFMYEKERNVAHAYTSATSKSTIKYWMRVYLHLLGVYGIYSDIQFKYVWLKKKKQEKKKKKKKISFVNHDHEPNRMCDIKMLELNSLKTSTHIRVPVENAREAKKE